MSSREGENGIRAMLILDVIGRPAQHLVEALEKITEEMGKEKGVVIKTKNIKEPTVMKDNKEFYTTFSEIEVEVEDILYLAILMFKYMPAHIEVISPETISLSNNGWSDILSELVRRLHSYDEVARILQIEKQELLKKIQEPGGEKKTNDESSKKKTSKKK
ncbi:MAG TPA: hypothetical protein VJ142_00745 [Candidatus Nanoarchaeia archaeon]|nr:hypothetical protein [Candidatus Nanoarchaeia archaeon]